MTKTKHTPKKPGKNARASEAMKSNPKRSMAMGLNQTVKKTVLQQMGFKENPLKPGIYEYKILAGKTSQTVSVDAVHSQYNSKDHMKDNIGKLIQQAEAAAFTPLGIPKPKDQKK